MTPTFKRRLIGCSALLILAVLAGAIAGYRWLHRAGAVVDRLQLVGPESEAFVTFMAESSDPAVEALFSSALARLRAAKRETQPEGLRFVADFVSGAGISKDPGILLPLRATMTIEKVGDGGGELTGTLSLGRMANLARLLLGVVDSEREKERWKGEKIILAPGRSDLSLSLVGNNLVFAHDPRAIRLVIDRLKAGAGGAGRLPDDLARCVRGLDPGGEMPGFGAIVNDRKALAAVWQLATGAPAGAEVPLPEAFEGVGFRFAVVSADALKGDGDFYFKDEEAAAGAKEALELGLVRVFSHLGLKPAVMVLQEGSRLEAEVEVSGVQAALDRILARLEGSAATQGNTKPR